MLQFKIPAESIPTSVVSIYNHPCEWDLPCICFLGRSDWISNLMCMQTHSLEGTSTFAIHCSSSVFLLFKKFSSSNEGTNSAMCLRRPITQVNDQQKAELNDIQRPHRLKYFPLFTEYLIWPHNLYSNWSIFCNALLTKRKGIIVSLGGWFGGLVWVFVFFVVGCGFFVCFLFGFFCE